MFSHVCLSSPLNSALITVFRVATKYLTIDNRLFQKSCFLAEEISDGASFLSLIWKAQLSNILKKICRLRKVEVLIEFFCNSASGLTLSIFNLS